MPRVNVAHQEVTRAGLAGTETTGDSANNHETPFHQRLVMRVRNAHATLARNFTLRIAKAVDGQTISHRIVSIPALATRLIGPMTDDYRQTDDKIYMDVETVDLFLTALFIP